MTTHATPDCLSSQDVTLMECGHTANGHLVLKGINGDVRVPCCVICSCTENAALMPDLEGRTARCPYRTCGNTKPSAWDLPFFEYRGPGSYAATETCVCYASRTAHDPLWRVEFILDRDWYEHGRIEYRQYKWFNAPGLVSAMAWAEGVVNLPMEQVFHASEETKIYAARLDRIVMERDKINDQRCGGVFQARGPEDDAYYCGCKERA